MQPLMLRLPGEYWDSYVYMGRLYLWTVNGSIETYNWQGLVDGIDDNPYTRLATQCAFAHGDRLYGRDLQSVFEDTDMVNVLHKKFAAGPPERVIRKSLLEKHRLGTQDNPFGSLHADATIYRRRLFAADERGVLSANCSGKTKQPVSTKVTRHWDGRAVGISAGWRTLAIASGSEGLWQSALTGKMDKPTSLSPLHASSCEWTYCSVYASSGVSGGYLADFEVIDADFGTPGRREPLEVKTALDIFDKSTDLTWGTKDKLCAASGSSIKVVRYNPWGESRLVTAGNVGRPKGALVAARTASFGMVLEYDDALAVIDSSGVQHHLDNAPVNWRVFPRSRLYENHLHIVRDDCLEIISFNHDYFVNQETKLAGTKQIARFAA